MGFFGYTARRGKQAAQPLHVARVDVDEALAASEEVLSLWWRARRLPEVPAFSGGLLDGWPAWAVDALGICRQEEQAVTDFFLSEAVARG